MRFFAYLKYLFSSPMKPLPCRCSPLFPFCPFWHTARKNSTTIKRKTKINTAMIKRDKFLLVSFLYTSSFKTNSAVSEKKYCSGRFSVAYFCSISSLFALIRASLIFSVRGIFGTGINFSAGSDLSACISSKSSKPVISNRLIISPFFLFVFLSLILCKPFSLSGL